VYLAREGKKVRKTFACEAEAKSWRVDALAAANRGALRPVRRDGRTLSLARAEFVEGMKAGTVRPKNRAAYKPNTIRSYERAVSNHIESSELGALKVADVQRQDVQEFADGLLAEGLTAGSVSNTLIRCRRSIAVRSTAANSHTTLPSASTSQRRPTDPRPGLLPLPMPRP